MASLVDPLSAPPPETPALSEASRIGNVFIAPSKTFTDLKRNSKWWAPWLLLSLFSLAFLFLVDRQIGFDQVSRNQIARSSRAEQFEKLPADQQAKQIQISSTITRYFCYSIPVVNLLVFVIVAAILMGTFSLAGAAVRFGTSLAIVIYGSLPGIIAALLAGVSLFAGVDREAFDINNPVATNPAYFMDAAGNRFLRGIASALDVFVIWSILLIGIGFSCNSKVTRRTAIVIVCAWYLFYKLLSSGLAAAFS